MPDLRIVGFEDLGIEPHDIGRLIECLPGTTIAGMERGDALGEHAPGTSYAARLEAQPDGRVSIQIYGPLPGTDPASAAVLLSAFLSRAIGRAYASATSRPEWNGKQRRNWNDLVFTALHAPLAEQDQDWSSAFKSALSGTQGLTSDTADQAVRVMDQHFRSMDEDIEPSEFIRDYQTELENLDQAVRRHAIKRTLEDRLADPGLRALSLRAADSAEDDDVKVRVIAEPGIAQPVAVHTQALAQAMQSAVRPGSPAATLRQVGHSAFDLNRAWQALSPAEQKSLKPELIRSLRF